MTLYKDIMPYFDKFIHGYGWNLSILLPPSKIWTPKNLTIINFRHPALHCSQRAFLNSSQHSLSQQGSFGHPNPKYHPSGHPLCCWWLIWPIQNYAKNLQKCLKPWHMGTPLRVLSKSFPMNTNMTGFRWFSKFFASLCFVQKKPQQWKG